MLAPKVRGQKSVASDDGWIVVGNKKEAEARKRIERKVELAKELEELQKEQEREALEKNPYLSNVKVDTSLKYADFDEIVKRTEKKDQQVSNNVLTVLNFTQERQKELERIEKGKQKKVKEKAKDKARAKAQKPKEGPTLEQLLSQVHLNKTCFTQ